MPITCSPLSQQAWPLQHGKKGLQLAKDIQLESCYEAQGKIDREKVKADLTAGAAASWRRYNIHSTVTTKRKRANAILDEGCPDRTRQTKRTKR
jgi:hypothetical protein